MTIIAFNRTHDEARPFETAAFSALSRRLVEVIGDDWTETIQNIHVSAQFLAGGTGEKDLSVFYRLASVGGSGATLYFFLARQDKNTGMRVYALYASTNEAGAIDILDPEEPGAHRNIVVFEENGPPAHSIRFVFDPELNSYVEEYRP